MLGFIAADLGPYVGLLIAIWIASLGVPIPEDIALLGGGLACYFGKAHLGLMIPVAMFAVLSGDLFIFYLGHRWASSLLEHRLTRWLATPERVNALRVQFQRHQLKTVFVARFLPGVRALVFLIAGAMRMSVWKFLATNGLAALISVPLLVWLGSFFGQSYDQLTHRVRHAEYLVLFVVILLVAGWAGWLYYSHVTRSRRRADDAPSIERKPPLGSELRRPARSEQV